MVLHHLLFGHVRPTALADARRAELDVRRRRVGLAPWDGGVDQDSVGVAVPLLLEYVKSGLLLEARGGEGRADVEGQADHAPARRLEERAGVLVVDELPLELALAQAPVPRDADVYGGARFVVVRRFHRMARDLGVRPGQGEDVAVRFAEQ